MKNFRYIKSILCIALMAFALTGCEESPSSPLSDFAGFTIDAPQAITVPKDATQSFEVKIYASETTSSDRMFSVIVDEDNTDLASPYSVPSQVTIPGGSNEGTLTFSVTDNDDLGFEAQDLVIAFEGFSGNEMPLSVTEECLDTIVTFNLLTDDWPDETTWEIYDLTGAPTIIYSGGPYANPADDFTQFTWDYCLPSGDYGVVVYDSYGDGGPTYSVISGGVALIPDTTVGGSNSSSTFTLD